jgi:hypothetical protein
MAQEYAAPALFCREVVCWRAHPAQCFLITRLQERNRPVSASSVEADTGLLVFSRALWSKKAQELREASL